MEFEKLIKERYSVREYDKRQLPKDVIEKILSSSHLAPTGCNYQPQRILVLNTDASLKKLKDCTRCHFDAPCAMLVCYNKEETWTRPYDGEISAPVDAAIVATHIMLAAQSLGVGSCWVMHFNPFKMREAFNIPENIVPYALITMGYAAKESVPNKLHTTFRPIGEVVVYDSFK